MTNVQLSKIKSIQGDILPFLIPSIRAIIEKIDCEKLDGLEEIRLRAGKPLMTFYRNSDWRKADVSLINFNKSSAITPPVFSGKLNRFLLFLNGSRAVRVEFSTNQDGMLGPIVLYFNPFTKRCVGGDIRM
jgi:hypothetical protein